MKGVIPAIPLAGKKEGKDKKEECAIQLTTQEGEFLKDVWRHPTSSVTERYVRLGFSRRLGTILQISLLRFGFLSSSWLILLNKRIKILELKEKGRKALGVSRGESDRHGGPEHRYWVNRMAEQLRADGYKVAEEVPVGGGKTVDLVASKDGRRIAFEIETGKSDAAANVRKCLDAGMDAVVVVATSADVRSMLARKLRPHPSVDLLTGSEAIKRLAER